MKRTKMCIAILSILLFLLCSNNVLAQEPPRYNLGSMQPTKELSISPGGEGVTRLYFYNIEGNRITHISLAATKAPKNWDISIRPALHTTTVEVSGVMVNVTENLYVEPSEAVDQIPTYVPEEIEYISSAVGYIPAKPVEITIFVPRGEKLGSSHNITVSASAEWLGQAGTVAIKQSRDFDYTVKVVAEEFFEKILERISKTKEYVLNVTKEAAKKAIETNVRLIATLERALNRTLDEKAIETLAEISSIVSQVTRADRELDVAAERSTLTLKVKYTGEEKAVKYTVYDVIPKSFARSSDEITVKASGAEIKIVETDPAYLFIYPQVYPDEEIEISYTVNKRVSSTVIDEAEMPSLYASSLEEMELVDTAIVTIKKISGFVAANASLMAGIGVLIGIVAVVVYRLTRRLVRKKTKKLRKRKR